MEGFVCDRCGAAIFPGERGTLRLYLQNANEEVGVMPAADEGQYGLADLCPKCFDAVRDIVPTGSSPRRPATGRSSTRGKSSDEDTCD